MDFQRFYPTPSELADRLVNLINRDFSGLTLEPSAGTGNLADAFKKRREWLVTFPDDSANWQIINRSVVLADN